MNDTVDGTLGSDAQPLRVAVVGSGPSGFYAAQALLKSKNHHVEVDMFDRLPTPYGLVRGGVAPDHGAVKNVVAQYDKAAHLPGFRFLGNVTVGRDLSVSELEEHYDQIVWAYGAEDSRRLGVPGEELHGVHPAAVFVGWYNGHPDYTGADIRLPPGRAAVIGNGNVAVDVARILLRDVDELEATEISAHALEMLAPHTINEVVVLGRGGPVQATYTIAELRELTRLDGVDVVVDPSELELDPVSARHLREGPPGQRKAVALLRELSQREPTPGNRRVVIRFCVSAAEMLGADGRVRALTLRHNDLQQGEDGQVHALPGEGREELPVVAAFTAIGFRSRAVPGLPLDPQRRVVPNTAGRVQDLDGERLPRHYAVGWAATGPRGTIGAHRSASGAVVNKMLVDLEDVPRGYRPSPAAVLELLRARGVDVVSFDDWKRIDAIEVDRGSRRGAPRDKLVNVRDMLQAAQT